MSTRPGPYVGRFAPSPTGPLHEGSLVAALGSLLDARAHHGRWLLRIEDIDPPREVPGAAEFIINQLQILGMHPDGPVEFQSRRGHRYEAALTRLRAAGHVYPCTCTRLDIARRLLAAGMPTERNRSAIYPGTCRPPNASPESALSGRSVAPPSVGTGARDQTPTADRTPAWRLRVGQTIIRWTERAWQPAGEDLARWEALAETTGDFVLKRADGLWAYQLAVVVDDGEQGITDIARGADLEISTARQIWLQRCLGLAEPRYLHLPLILDGQGEKLSKQTGAKGLDLSDPLAALRRAADFLGLGPIEAQRLEAFWPVATARWADRFRLT